LELNILIISGQSLRFDDEELDKSIEINPKVVVYIRGIEIDEK